MVITAGSSFLCADKVNFELAGEANAKGDYQTALDYSLKALQADINSSKADNNVSNKRSHELVIGTDYNNIGYFYKKLGKHKEALEHYFKALEIKESKPGKQNRSLTIYYNNIGATYDEMGEYKKAMEYYSKSLDIYEKVLAEDHPYIAGTKSDIGEVYRKMGENQKALEYQLEALEIREKGLGDKHHLTLDSYFKVGGMYEILEKYQEATDYYTKALAIYVKERGVDDNLTQSINERIVTLKTKIPSVKADSNATQKKTTPAKADTVTTKEKPAKVK